MNFEDELEAIKHKKLAELQKEAATKAMMSSITEPIGLTDSNFANVISKYPIMLVDFWAPWCGPCRMVSPIVETLGRSHAGRLKVVKLDIDGAPEIAARHGVQGIPLLVLFEGGQEVDRLVGAGPGGQPRRGG